MATALLAVLAGSVFAQPASAPLLTRSTVVKPNLLFVFDTSGSMNQSEVYASHYVNATGTDNTCGSGGDARDKSPVNNLIHYNPEKVYLPRVDSNGNALPNGPLPWQVPGVEYDGSPPQKPGDPTGTEEKRFDYLEVWLPKPGVNVQSFTSKADICNTNNYNTLRIKMSNYNGGSNYATSPAQVKINPGTFQNVVGNPFSTSRTLAEERQNISNWATYYRRRMDSAKTGTSKAFVDQADTFRLGYTTIYATSATSTAVTDRTRLWGVKDYGLAKADFYTWLHGQYSDGATPLRAALDVAGQYFSRSDNNGPWAHSPWLANSQGEMPKDHLSCRRNFTILVTDGEWNDDQAFTSDARKNVDGTVGPVLTHSSGSPSYQYIPRSTDPRSVGKADKVGTSSDYSNTLADVAMYYWVRDLRPDLANNVTPGKQTDAAFWQNMSVYTAAFGPVGSLTAAQVAQAKAGQINWTSVQPISQSGSTRQPQNIDDLIHAAHNAGGEFMTLTDAASFATELGRVVASIASSEQFSQAGVAASAVALTAGTRKFVPYYTTNQWWGNLKMISLSTDSATLGDENGVVWEVVETDNLGKPTGNARFSSPATRKIYTWSPSTRGIEFLWSRLSPDFLASGPASNTATLLHNTVTADVIDYLRGARTLEGDGKTFRRRESILGDIVNSTPVFIKNNSNFGYERLPATTPGLASYSTYMAAKSARNEGVLFIGANDGMLHAFREGTAPGTGGYETFAFIPQGVLGNVHDLASKSYQHRYYVDGPMTESDAYIPAPDLSGSGTVTRWTNLVLGSAGAGGRTVFALDATQPLAMNDKSVLWEANFKATGMADLGYVMNPIETGITASGDWVAILGNGPYGSSGSAYLFILNLATGELLKKIQTNSDTGNGLGGVRVVRNANGMIVGAYAGDLRGNVWRFDLSAASKASWPNSGQLLFSAKDPDGQPQPITATPGVVPRADTHGGYMVVVGTGKLYDDSDHLSTQKQAAYGLWDKATFGGTGTFSAIPGAATLVPVSAVLEKNGTSTTNLDGATSYYRTTASRTVDWATDRGWTINYDLLSGQRTIFSIEPTKAVVRVDTIAPRANQVACAAGSSPGVNYLVQPLTGTCRADATFDLNGDGKFEMASDTNACIYTTEADGEDVVLDIKNPDGTSSDYVDIQDSRGHVRAKVDGCSNCSPPPPKLNGVRRSWRQLFMRQK